MSRLFTPLRILSRPSVCARPTPTFLRYRSTPSKTVEPIEPPAPPPLENQGAADLFDEVEIDGAEWEGEEIQEGVYVSEPTIPSRPNRPQTTSIKHLNRLLSRHTAPDIPEHELDEKFVRGRGPGGQAINKTNSSVSLRHIPTGIRIQSQPTRSREQNRAVARQILKERLDLMRARGELPGQEVQEIHEPPEGKKIPKKERLAAEARLWSKQELRWEKERRRKANRAKKVKRRKNESGNENQNENENQNADTDNDKK